MRMVFLIVVLAGGLFYSWVAFADLNFLTNRGRLGPGFFPRIIGVGMVLMTLWVLIQEVRSPAIAAGNAGEDETGAGWSDVVTLIALALGYAVVLRLFGGFLATLIFLAVALSVLNRGRPLQNAIIAVAVPSGVYLLFDRILNANTPPALIDLPF